MNSYYLFQHENGMGFSKVGKEDLGTLLNLKTESWKTTHNISLINEDNQLRWYESLVNEDIHTPKNLVLMVHMDLNEPRNPGIFKVGVWKVLHIDWYNMKADVAWDIFKNFRGKGLGKKLVEAGVGFCKQVLNLRKLNAEILSNNPASMKCAKAAGFAQEGCKMQEVLRDGQFLDSYMMGLILPTVKVVGCSIISPPQSKTSS